MTKGIVRKARLALLGAAAALLFSPGAARAACTLGLTLHNANPSYSMFNDTDLGLLVDFEVTHGLAVAPV